MRNLCFFLAISCNVLFCQTRLPINDSVQNFLFSQSVKKSPIIITTNGVFEFKSKWEYTPFSDNSFKKEINETEKEKTIYTNKDKFEYLSKINTNLSDLKNKLGLDYEF